jgi:hypothetical protein
MARTHLEPAAEPEGTAGYVSPYPYLERLQEKMEERLARKVPSRGRFCGFCYGRLREDDECCPFCGTPAADDGPPAAGRRPVEEIPQPVLRAYQARQKTEARWVHGGAFVGLIIASVLFIVLELWGPGPLGHPAAGFVVLIFGGYLLAQLFGTVIGAQIGYRAGAKRRDELWGRFLAERDGGRREDPA